MKVPAILACLVWLCLPSLADDLEEIKLYGGYQFTRLDSHAAQDALNLQNAINPTFPLLKFGNYQNLNGWNAGLDESAFAKWFSIVADVSGSYGTNNVNLGTVGNVSSRARTRLRLFSLTAGAAIHAKTQS